jgi:hypothetical protein
LARIVLARQTAGTIARSAASSTAATLLKLLGNDINTNSLDIMTKVVADEPNHLQGSLFGFEQAKQYSTTQHRQLKTTKTNAFGNLLQMKFDSRLIGIWQIWFRLEKHDGHPAVVRALMKGSLLRLGQTTRTGRLQQRRFSVLSTGRACWLARPVSLGPA